MRKGQRVATERLLCHVYPTARIAGVTSLGGDWAPVERLSLENGASVVVKTRRDAAGNWGDAAAVWDNEYRGLALVSTLGLDVTPHLLGADTDAGVLMMTDVGIGPSVQHVLFGDSAADADSALVALARASGVLHAASMGSTHPWQQRATFLDQTFDLWPELCDACASLGFDSPSAGVSTDLDALEAALLDPQFCVFVHGDVGPNNAVLVGGRARLVDFESSGFRHFALDAAALRLPFPAYGHWAVIPDPVIAAMDVAYRTELARGWSGAGEDDLYEVQIAAGCAAWAIIRAHRLPLIASTGKDPELAVRRRTQIVQMLTSFVEIARGARCYPALGSWFMALIEQMQERWEEARLPPRVFRPYDDRGNRHL